MTPLALQKQPVGATLTPYPVVAWTAPAGDHVTAIVTYALPPTAWCETALLEQRYVTAIPVPRKKEQKQKNKHK